MFLKLFIWLFNSLVFAVFRAPDTDFNEYEIISNVDVDKDLFILCNSKKSILSRSMYALSSLFFSPKKEYCYLPSWGFFVTCGLNTKYDKNAFKYIY